MVGFVVYFRLLSPSEILNGFKNRLIYSIPKTISGDCGPELAYWALKFIIRPQFHHA